MLLLVSSLSDPRCSVASLWLHDNAIGVDGGNAIATLIDSMTSLTELDLAGNMLCGISSLDTSDGPRPPAPYTTSALAAIVRATRRSCSLTRLGLANNRICAVWSDAYGEQRYGPFVADGMHVVTPT